MRHQRLLELDALRGIAALSVVIYHYFYRYNQLYAHDGLNVTWSALGNYGVHLFFMISGFVIFWTLEKTRRPLDFIVSRFSRLYPAYWLAVIATFSIVLIFGLPGREVSLFDAITNLLMFHEYLGVPHVDGVYWTLTVELSFYFWMFLLYLTSNLNRVEEIFSVLVILSILHSLEIFSIPWPLYKIFILNHLSLFLAGICFYKIIQGSSSKKTLFALALTLLSSLAIYNKEVFILFSCFYLLFYLAVSGRFKVLCTSPLLFLGGISYSLYLLHQNIGYVIINKSYDLGLHPLVGIFSALVFVLLLSTIFMKYIEKPALRLMREAYKDNQRMQWIAERLTLSDKR